MARPHRHDKLPLRDLKPQSPVADVPLHGQVEAMRELRTLSNNVADSFRARDERLLALAASHSLSRKDMARATGLNKSRVDQIIREMAERQQERWNVAAAERVRRNLPNRDSLRS